MSKVEMFAKAFLFLSGSCRLPMSAPSMSSSGVKGKIYGSSNVSSFVSKLRWVATHMIFRERGNLCSGVLWHRSWVQGREHEITSLVFSQLRGSRCAG